MVKSRRSNSILFEKAASITASDLGLSDGRMLKKYLQRCQEAGLCTKIEQYLNIQGVKAVYQFISYGKALSQLLGINKYQQRHFPLHKNLRRFKDYQYQIELDLVGLNISQQAYRCTSNFPNKNNIIHEINRLAQLPVSERQSRSNRSKRSKLVKRYSTADRKIQESLTQGHCKDVVTGCMHIARQIGMSDTTGAKRVKKWIAENTISVKDVITFRPTASVLEASYLIEDLIIAKVKGIHLYSKKDGGVKTIVGKRVLGFVCSGYSYGSLQKIGFESGKGLSAPYLDGNKAMIQ